MRTIFIGDVHGCLDELRELVSKLEITPDDRVILLGDLINKWPDSAGVVKFAIEHGFEAVCGNHERAYLRLFETVDRYQELRAQLSQEEHDWIVSLPYFIETDQFIAVHAGLVPEKSPSETDPGILCEIRTWNASKGLIGNENEPAWHSFYQEKKPVFYGHWAKQRRHFTKNTFGLDDGCVYGGSLSAYVLETEELVTVPARKMHEPLRSVLVIARNEAERIEQCLDSLKNQSIEPHEIIVVAHNCSDDTAEKVRRFTTEHDLKNLTLDEWSTNETGPIHARIRAFELAQCNIIACIDGDAVADRRWLERITEPLIRDTKIAAVGWRVDFFEDFFGSMAAMWFFGFGQIRPGFHFYFWGANFAFRRSAYVAAGGWEPLIDLKNRLGLHYPAEDCALSLALEKMGEIAYVPRAVVTAHPGSEPNSIGRGLKQEADRKKLFEYFLTK